MPAGVANEPTERRERAEHTGRPKRVQPAERVEVARRPVARRSRRRSSRRPALRRYVRGARRRVSRLWRALGSRSRFKLRLLTAVVVLTAPLWSVNLAVAFFGHSVVFPLSPFFLREKVSALASYATHRPKCWAYGHEETDGLVKRAEARHHLPRGLLAAVVHVESRGFPHRISSAGAMGPGQLMPGTARQLGVGDPFDSTENIEGAAHLLAAHLARFHDVRLAVAAYNAGPGAVRGRVPNNGQTPAYVAKVMHTYAALRPRPLRRTTTVPSRRPPSERAPMTTGRGPVLALTGFPGDRR